MLRSEPQPTEAIAHPSHNGNTKRVTNEYCSGMARIRNFTQATSHSSLHPTETDAEWSILESEEGRMLQISTFGSENRASGPKVSQTIQLNRETASLLRAAIEATFPSL